MNLQVSLETNQQLLSESEVVKICANVVYSSSFGLARIQKANSALHETIGGNELVANFNSGVRYDGETHHSHNDLKNATEKLRLESIALAKSAISDFAKKQHQTLILIFKNFQAVIDNQLDAQQAENQRLIDRLAQAIGYLESRHTTLVNRFWTELVNQILEESALLQYAESYRTQGKSVKTNPHGSYLEPIGLCQLQATVDRELSMRNIIIHRTQAALNAFVDQVQILNKNQNPKLSDLQFLASIFKDFVSLMQDGLIVNGVSSKGSSSAGFATNLNYLSQITCDLTSPDFVHNSKTETSKALLDKIIEISKKELLWLKWSVPFCPAFSSAEERKVGFRHVRNFFSDQALIHGERPVFADHVYFKQDLTSALFGTRYKSQLQSNDEQIAHSRLKDKLKTLNACDNLLTKRNHKFLPDDSELSISQYGGYHGILPSDKTLETYAKFQTKYLIDLSDTTPRTGIAKIYSADWLRDNLKHNNLLVTEIALNGELLGLVFSFTEFAELIVGINKSDILRSYGKNVTTLLHEANEYGSIIEQGEVNLTQTALCRTKPVENIAWRSHHKHGWSIKGIKHVNSDGVEYNLITKELVASQGYQYDGKLQPLSEELACIHNLQPDQLHTQHQQRVQKAKEREFLNSDSQKIQAPDSDKLNYKTPQELYKKLFLSTISPESSFRAWEVYSAEEIYQQIKSLLKLDRPAPALFWLKSICTKEYIAPVFNFIAPEEFENTKKHISLNEILTTCERIARRAKHMCVQKNKEWLGHVAYTEKPLEVVKLFKG